MLKTIKMKLLLPIIPGVAFAVYRLCGGHTAAAVRCATGSPRRYGGRVYRRACVYICTRAEHPARSNRR